MHAVTINIKNIQSEPHGRVYLKYKSMYDPYDMIVF